MPYVQLYGAHMFNMNRVFLILLLSSCVGAAGDVLGDAAPPELDRKRHPVSNNNNDWQLKFNDEFDGTDLDLTRFSPCKFNWDSCEYDRTRNLFRGDSTHIKLNNGSLDVIASCQGDQLLGGHVSTFQKMSHTYGYFETRVRLDRDIDGDFAVWTTADSPSKKWPPEFDVCEFGNRDGTTNQGSWKDPGKVDETVIFNIEKTQWHTYGYDWRPGKVTFYVDGEVKLQISSPDIPTIPMMIIATYEDFKETWDGTVNCSDLPAAMHIDYMRLWQKTGTPGATYSGPVSSANIPAPDFLAP